MAVIDQTLTWRKVEERLETETDPVLRRNLELLLTHMKAETVLDLPTLMSTVSEKSVYQNFAADPSTWPRGKAGVQAFYENFATGIYARPSGTLAFLRSDAASYLGAHPNA